MGVGAKCVFFALLALLGAASGTLWGLKKVRSYQGRVYTPQLYALNPATGDILQTVNLVHPTGIPPNTATDNAFGLTWDPVSQRLFAVMYLGTGAAAGRKLITIDRASGQMEVIGGLAEEISTIAFSCHGVLYGVTGDTMEDLVQADPEVLFEIDPATAQLTRLFRLGNGAEGEAIDFDCTDNKLYHWSGYVDPGGYAGGRIFERVDPLCPATTNIPITGSTVMQEVYSGTWVDSINAFAVTGQNKQYGHLSRTGVYTYKRATATEDQIRGLADDSRKSTVRLSEVVLGFRLPQLHLSKWAAQQESALSSDIAAGLGVPSQRVKLAQILRDESGVFVSATVVNVTHAEAVSLPAAAASLSFSTGTLGTVALLDAQAVCTAVLLPACAVAPRLQERAQAGQLDVQALSRGLDLEGTAFPSTAALLSEASSVLLTPSLWGGSVEQPRSAFLTTALLDAERARTVRLRWLCAAFKLQGCDAPNSSLVNAAVKVARYLQTLMERRGC